MTSGDAASHNQLGMWEAVAHLIVTTEKSGWPKLLPLLCSDGFCPVRCRHIYVVDCGWSMGSCGQNDISLPVNALSDWFVPEVFILVDDLGVMFGIPTIIVALALVRNVLTKV